MELSSPAPPAGSVSPDARGAFRYVCWLVLVQAGMLSFCFWATLQPWFFEHDGDPMFRAVGYAQRVQGAPCEVVTYGDSTALAGFVSAEIERRTGLKTCNVSEFRLIEDFVGVDFPLDQYLAHHAAPRFLVTGWTPSNLNLAREPAADFSPENLLYGMTFDRGPWMRRQMLMHPGAALAYLTWAERVLLEDSMDRLSGQRARTWAVDERARRDSQGGTWSIEKPPQQECNEETTHFQTSTRSENVAGVAAFRQRYEKNGTTVLVEAMPVAACDVHVPEYRALVNGLTDNSLEVLPIGDFNDSNIHLSPEASLRFSDEVSEQILARLHRPEAQPSPGGAAKAGAAE